MNKKIYFILQLKRVFKLYPAILLITMMTVLSIAITGTVLLQQYASEQNKNKISVGIVGDAEESFFGIGIETLQSLDDFVTNIEITMLEEEEALKALRNREISGYLYLPENYVENITVGKNVPAKFIMRDGPESFAAAMSSEITEIISTVVTESQRGMYGMQRFSKKYNRLNLTQKTEDLVFIYIDNILNRSKLYKHNVLGIADVLSTVEYYICGILLFFLLLWGISCNKIFTSKNKELSRLLNFSGMDIKWQLICEYLAFLIITILTLQIFAVVFGAAVEYGGFVGVDIDVFSAVLFVFKILPVIIMITLMHSAFYELVPDTVNSVLLQFLTAVGLGYISGCFYPNYFFPEFVQDFAAVLPSGVGFAYIRRIMSDTLQFFDFCFVAAYIMLFATITFFGRKRRILR